VCELGAHYVIDHAQPLSPQIGKLGCGPPGFVLSTTHTGAHLPAIAEVIAPQGRFALIDDALVFDINPFKRKSVSAHWEFMFTRSMFATADIAEQGKLLNEVARLIAAHNARRILRADQREQPETSPRADRERTREGQDRPGRLRRLGPFS
jgi:NADPH:quinone reductase-like Zn-dependent oxidoreductase